MDNISGTEDKDVGFVAVEADANYGNSLFFYLLDATSTCGGIDTAALPPKYFPAADGGDECWELASVHTFSTVSPMKLVPHSAGNDTLTANEVANTMLYVTVAADFTLPEIGNNTEIYEDSVVNMVPLGSSFCVFTVGAIQIDIDPHANNSINLVGVDDTDGHRIENTAAAGDSICLTACEPDTWCVLANPSAWVAGDV